jgi:hypothetical protein
MVTREPITDAQLREIFTDLGYPIPADDKLHALAVILTARNPEYDWKGDFPGFPVRLLDFLGNEYIIRAPLFPPDMIPYDWEQRKPFGPPRYAEPTTWRWLTNDMRQDLYKAMGRRLGCDRTARFLERVIPLVTGEEPEFKNIKKHLVSPAPKYMAPRERVR